MRRTARRLTRVAIRTRWRVPDDLGAALVAYRRAIRAHRRLARLAPAFFDSAVVERERQRHEERCRWMALWEPIIARAYGCEPKPPQPTPDLPPLPSPRTQRAIEGELASWNFWLTAGRLALERHKQRRPHALVNLSRLARLLEIGFDFGRLACGLDSSPPSQQPPSNHDQALADLERAYGNRPDANPPGPATAPAPDTTVPSAAQATVPPQPATPAGDTPSAMAPLTPITPSAPIAAPADPSPTGQFRRDAWSSWARHQRQRGGRNLRFP